MRISRLEDLFLRNNEWLNEPCNVVFFNCVFMYVIYWWNVCWRFYLENSTWSGALFRKVLSDSRIVKVTLIVLN